MHSTICGILLIVTLVQAAWTVEGASGSIQTLVLQPAPGVPLRIDFNFNFNKALAPFAKEPAAPGKEYARGLIPTVPPTPFLRNISDSALYLNQDHTQDFVMGKFDTYRSTYQGHVIFRELRVSTVQEPLVIPYTVDLFTYEYGCAGWLSVRSGWAGQLDLGGQKWRLGIVDNLDGRIGDQDILYLESGRKDRRDPTISVSPVPKTLFLDGHALDMSFAFKPGATGVVLEATVAETQLPLGHLNIAAQGCRFLRLQNEKMATILEASGGKVTLPAGVYQIVDCVLSPARRPTRGPAFISCDQRVSIDPGQTASLRIGPPLRNTVRVTRDQNMLRLTYQLLGTGGEHYEYYNWTNRPQFNIYKGPVKIASGALPFG